jgi:hypothetical protein
MRHGIRILAASLFGSFLALTLWRLLFQGALEKTSLAATHLDAGAGDWGLVVQFVMAIFAAISAVALAFIEPQWTRKTSALVIVLVAPALFIFTARGMQRFGPAGFSESTFVKLAASYRSGSVLKANDVTHLLGEPLIREKLADGCERWLYTYMPSCGFVWDKRYVFFDRSGQVKDVFAFDEP